MKKRIENLIVTRHTSLTDTYFVLDLKSSKKLPEMLPAQFAEVKVERAQNTFLRRPISIHDVDYEKGEMRILVEIKGEATREMSKLRAGDSLNLVYPLGKAFHLPAKAKKVLLAGGGCGVAPLLFAARYFQAQGIEVHTLIGGRNAEQLLRLDAYARYSKVYTITEDGSHGETGLITAHSIMQDLKQFDAVYTCGPEAMMKAIAGKAQDAGVYCEVSLENLMACGIGACLCCVQDTVHGHQCVCTEGPVFNIKDLKW